MDPTGAQMSEARHDVERLARAGVGMEEISETLQVRDLAAWEQDLLRIYARGISNGALSVGGERYLASLGDEIGA